MLTTTQMLMIAAAAAYFLFFRGKGGGGVEWFPWIRKILGGQTEDIIGKLIADFYNCNTCTPEEEKKVEEALAIVVNHAIKHHMIAKGEQSAEQRLQSIEAYVQGLKDGKVSP